MTHVLMQGFSGMAAVHGMASRDLMPQQSRAEQQTKQ
jgi:hypothetical protein